VSRARSFIFIDPPWHPQHFSASSGATSFRNETFAGV
jgi:hypothetical protein